MVALILAPEASVGGWAAAPERREAGMRSKHQQERCMMSECCLTLYQRISKREQVARAKAIKGT